MGRARAAFLSGLTYSASKALEWGLVHQVFPDRDTLDQGLEELLGHISRTGPKASRAAKELVRISQAYGDRPEKLKDLTCQMIASLRVSPEGLEGMRALLEKRKPSWGTES